MTDTEKQLEALKKEVEHLKQIIDLKEEIKKLQDRLNTLQYTRPFSHPWITCTTSTGGDNSITTATGVPFTSTGSVPLTSSDGTTFVTNDPAISFIPNTHTI